jgi:DNA-directed RNA polymerase specialized sigma subunit
MQDKARSFLKRARYIDHEINNLLKIESETRDRVLSITQRYDGDGAQSVKDPHKFDRLAELSDLINQKIDELVETKQEIFQMIEKLPDRRQRNVCNSYYVRMKTFEEIAVEEHYSYRQVKRIHSKSLLLVDVYLREK